MTSNYIFTSESVTSGHPDKLCDQISDALVGTYLRRDPHTRIVAESAVSTGIVFISIKAASDAMVDVPSVARSVILDTGYRRGGFDGRNCTVMTSLSDSLDTMQSSSDKELSDNELDALAVLDNVTVFGYACRHTNTLMPLPISLAHAIVRRLDAVRADELPYLTPDGKCQVGVAFRNNVPERLDSVTLVASQWAPQPTLATLREELMEAVIRPALGQEGMEVCTDCRVQINPEGTVLAGGPSIHAGLTGRKHGVDTYGSYSRMSSAALSGKDPTRIDRVGIYAARHAAKNIVHAGLADECEVQLSYSIGLPGPVSVSVYTHGTGKEPDRELTRRILEVFDFRLGAIIKRFRLRELAAECHGEFYQRLAVYGQVGRTDLPCPWEEPDEADKLR